jgi:hypothetical protein
MADIPSPAGYTKLNDIEIANEKPVTTSLFTKFGGNVNKLIDDVGTLQLKSNITPIADKSSVGFSEETGGRKRFVFGEVTTSSSGYVLIYFPLITMTQVETTDPVLHAGISLYRGLPISGALKILPDVMPRIFAGEDTRRYSMRNGFISGQSVLVSYGFSVVTPLLSAPFLFIDNPGIGTFSYSFAGDNTSPVDTVLTFSNAFMLEI